MITVWNTAISRRIRTLLPTSCQRRSGVAWRRLRISFWRSATSGTAENTPSCMSDMPRIDGTRYEMNVRSAVWIGWNAGWTAGGWPVAAWFTAARTNPTSWRVDPSAELWLGSVYTVTLAVPVFEATVSP